jgi:tetratricopeptide (TPR) repeat protein
MPALASADPAARARTNDGRRAVHDHLFAAANTAVPAMVGRPAHENAARVEQMRRAARVDLFGLKEGGHIEGRLHAPLRPALPVLEPGRRYLLEVVVRTLGVGHALTQGTADSNEVWLDLAVRVGGRLLARSGGLGPDGAVDDWAWFGNAYLLDRDGNRIERRNAQDIVVALYDHQVPPGAAAVVHYALEVPPGLDQPIEITAALRYRKFDTRFYRHVRGAAFAGNDLPITTLAQDRLTLPVGGATTAPATRGRGLPAWERWNDYGIGLLREGRDGESRQAEAAFARVATVGRAEGPLNLARVLYREGRLAEAAAALEEAAGRGAPPWVVAWYTGLIARDLGDLDRAIAALEALAETRFNAARARGFDFSGDDRMLTTLGRTLYERARQERGAARREGRRALLGRARGRLEQALAVDPESAAAHHNLSLVLHELGEPALADRHRALHETHRRDDNAVERAVTLHRSRNPAADHAAEPVAIYALKPVGEPARRLAGPAVEQPVVRTAEPTGASDRRGRAD